MPSRRHSQMSIYRFLTPFLVTTFTLPMIAAAQDSTTSARITVDVAKPGAAISPLLYGIFFEEINRAGDGGIYAEMVQNRSFEDADFPVAWSLNQGANVAATIALDKSKPLNSQNPTSLKLTVSKSSGGRAALVNRGFVGVPERGAQAEWRTLFENARGGMSIEQGKKYDLTFYARANAGFSGPLTVSLERSEGGLLAAQQVSGLGIGWKKFTVSLTANATDESARLVIATAKPGTVWLDMVSMFPKDTWKQRPNGLRSDLMEKIAAIKPAFVRFPGGCFVEGDEIENRFQWKQTIGDIAARPGHWNLWGYRSTNGLGYHEYLQMCEDLKSEPLFVVNVGMSHHAGQLNNYAVPMSQMGPYVQDALDAIEYANGPVTSKWGALRAKNGHPKPFNMKMMQIGNENGGASYDERYALFHDAIKAKYPNIQLVACDWGGVPKNRPLDIIDPHLYSNPQTMIGQANRFDDADRKGPHIYFGEYAVTQESGTGNLQAAVGEAAFMTGLERNGDIVKMSSYAPLLSHIDWKAWNPNAIVYDQKRVYGTPSYYVQQMFGANRGDVNIPVQIQQPAPDTKELGGKIGLGTWVTQAEYKDIKVVSGTKTLFESDFSKGLQGWQQSKGQWTVVDGALRQTGRDEAAQIVTGDASWHDYTLTLKARKISGDEGFLVSFALPGDATRVWWNIGGWVNTAHGMEIPGMSVPRVPGRIETGRWYDIKVELDGTMIRAYLDGKLIQEVNREAKALYAVAGRDNKTGETILKIVNASRRAVRTTVDLSSAKQLKPAVKALELTGAGPLAENSFSVPNRITPRPVNVQLSNNGFTRTFPAQSVTVFRLGINP